MSPFHKSTTLALAFIVAAASSTAKADTDIDAKAKEVAKSLVVIEYTLGNENASQAESGQGILIQKDGVILVSGSFIPEAFPKEWIKDLKVRLPENDFNSVPATFLGRTKNHLFAFLKLDKPIKAPIFEPGDTAPTKLGESVFSVAVLGKGGGYETYVGVSHVKTLMDLTHSIAGTSSFGLTKGMSPVFDLPSGNLVGLTLPSLGEGMILREGANAHRIELTDEDQSSAYLPNDEIKTLFTDIPTKPFTIDRPWLAVDEITGLQEDVKTLKDIKQPAGVVIGAVVPGEPADKAGLQAQDIILTVDGKQFSKSPVPELMVMHFTRLIEKHNPGDVITLGILRGEKKMDVKVTLGTSPKTSAEMTHVFSPRIGVVTRDLVFSDAYARKLPQDTKGVMVALVKNGAAASLGSTPLHAGLIITKVDEQPVENQQQFLDAMKKLEENKDAREAVFVVITPKGETSVCRIDLTK